MEEIQVSKTYKVGDREFSTLEEATKAAAMEVLYEEIPKGLDNVVAKANDIIKALNVVNKSS